MAGVCSTQRGNEKCVENFIWNKSEGKTPRRKRDDNIKHILKK